MMTELLPVILIVVLKVLFDFVISTFLAKHCDRVAFLTDKQSLIDQRHLTSFTLQSNMCQGGGLREERLLFYY
jgi:hypothetical protein